MLDKVTENEYMQCSFHFKKTYILHYFTTKIEIINETMLTNKNREHEKPAGDKRACGTFVSCRLLGLSIGRVYLALLGLPLQYPASVAMSGAISVLLILP